MNNKIKMMYGSNAVEINEETIFIKKKTGNLIIKGDITRDIGNRVCYAESGNIASVVDDNYEWYLNIINGNESQVGKVTDYLGKKHRILKRADGHYLLDNNNNDIAYFGLIANTVKASYHNKSYYDIRLYTNNYDFVGTMGFNIDTGKILDIDGYINRMAIKNKDYSIYKTLDIKRPKLFRLEVNGDIISTDKVDFVPTNNNNFVQAINTNNKNSLIDLRTRKEWQNRYDGNADYIGYDTFAVKGAIIKNDKILYSDIRNIRSISRAGLVTIVFNNGAVLHYNGNNGEYFRSCDFPKQYNYEYVNDKVIKIKMKWGIVFVDTTTMTEVR